jgi:PKD repeat protein
MKFETRVFWWVLVALAAAMGSACGDGGGGGQANEPPTASFIFFCTDLSCDFDGSASSDPDGNIASYSWAFGDGGTASGATAAHTYDSAGTRTVTLTVTDDDGATDSAARSVSVTEGDVTVLPVYEYELASVPPDDPIVVDAPFGDGVRLELGCIYGCPNLKGRYELESGDFTIDAGAHMTVRELNQPVQLFGMFDITVSETVIIPSESRPTSGILEVDSWLPSVPGYGFIDVTILPAGTGVRLALDETNDGTIEAQVEVSWEEFDELLGSEEPQWQQLGAFGYGVMVDFMPELLQYGIAGILLVETTADMLPMLSPVTGECTAFSDVGLTVPPPPPIVPDQGFETFTWFDDAASGDVNAGDSFSLDFDYCLLYFSEDDSDLNNGLIEMNSWTEVVTDGVLTRVGFEGTSPAGKPGGLVFEDFEMWAVWDADSGGPGISTVSSLEATVNGRMTVVFFEPAD